MAARLSKGTDQEEPAQELPSQRKRPDGRFRLQVDRQTKQAFTTLEAAEAAGIIIKKNHPILQVAVYDHLESINKIIQLPEG
jgi:hypothetical protein